jgi:dTDP-4-amino-4,6-dideoxygalactose transaminase
MGNLINSRKAITSLKKIPFNKPALAGKEIQYIRDAVKRGQLSGDGFYTFECQKVIERLTSSPKALLTHSCTAALEMAALLCDLKAGDEVIMPSFTFVSTANAVALRGAVPVFVDIEPETLNIDPKRVIEAITSKTRAIFAVHYAGFPADMDTLQKIAIEANNSFLIEDAAQALGSTYKGRPCGSLGDLATFSFHETKNISSGEGGALTINKRDFFERAEIIREKGTNRSSFFRGQVDKYTWVDVGSSYLPGELNAAYLLAQLEITAAISAERIRLFNRYMAAFSSLEKLDRIRLPRTPPESEGNGHMFYLLMQNLDDRMAFINHMRDNNIITPFHYVPLHSSPAGALHTRHVGSLDNTTRVSEALVRMPMFFELGSDIEKIIDIAIKYFKINRKRKIKNE